jgi:hypothetical protein
LFPFFRWGIKSQGSRKDSPLACLLKHWKDLNPKVFTKSDSSFTAPRLGHSILRKMRKDGQKEGALIIIPFLN